LITYIDTSALLKLLVDDEPGRDGIEALWLASTAVVCCELGYVEARAALAAAHRARRVTAAGLRDARLVLDELWAQLDVVPITTSLIRAAADLAEQAPLRGDDAVHLAAALTVPVDAFASSDVRLCEAARANGLHVTNPT
jgi:predicted nucleic acid-binding protein